MRETKMPENDPNAVKLQLAGNATGLRPIWQKNVGQKNVARTRVAFFCPFIFLPRRSPA
jgi:hypothetical protein